MIRKPSSKPTNGTARDSGAQPPAKQDEIVAAIRKRILSGELIPGQKLLARAEIEQEFVASTVTVQRALLRLVDDGFIVTKERQGTFVADEPPHLCRYVLSFPECMSNPGWNRLWTVVVNMARCFEESLPLSMPIYTGVNGLASSKDYHALLRDVRARRLAGIIFASNPYLLEDTPLLEGDWLPRVAIMRGERHGIPGVDTDYGAFMDMALDRLASLGRKRIALITTPPLLDPDRFAASLAERGMTSRPGWVQVGDLGAPSWTANTMLLLMEGSRDTLPDGIVVTDDNLVEHACLGLARAGVIPGKELDVIAHCNFPAPTPSMVPVIRLGFDIREVLKRCIEVLDIQRRGETPPSATSVSPIFESEVVGGGTSMAITWPEKASAKAQGKAEGRAESKAK